ncbi:hypothetical protein ACFYST_00680 [Kitasatospora sp. NPDC004614]|uniref:hypothetical protein n=1 Tax=unclassified Kitasatospora TaxID=2633591 RepID=UPI00367FC1EE
MAAARTFGGPARRPRARLFHALLLALVAALALLVHHSISAEASPAMPGMAHHTATSAGSSVPHGQVAHSPAGQQCATGMHCVGTDVRGPVLTAPPAHPVPAAAAPGMKAGGPHDGRHPAGPSPPDPSLLSVLRI